MPSSSALIVKQVDSDAALNFEVCGYLKKLMESTDQKIRFLLMLLTISSITHSTVCS